MKYSFDFSIGSNWKVGDLVAYHKELRPKMGARDVYKLLYQGVFGVGHILGEGAWNGLKMEAEHLDLSDQPSEPIIEPVSLDGSIIRVNLRPYLRKNHKLRTLMNAIISSEIEGEQSVFLQIWDNFANLVLTKKLEFDSVEVYEINNILDRANPKPMHHTETYRGAYHPAYRVAELDKILKII